MDSSRRTFLTWAALVPAAVLTGRTAQAAEAGCYDPAALPLSVRNRRNSLGFVEQSTDATRRCGLCAFFQPGEGNCGSCQLMVGAPVTIAGVCNSFAAKSG